MAARNSNLVKVFGILAILVLILSALSPVFSLLSSGDPVSVQTEGE